LGPAPADAYAVNLLDQPVAARDQLAAFPQEFVGVKKQFIQIVKGEAGDIHAPARRGQDDLNLLTHAGSSKIRAEEADSQRDGTMVRVILLCARSRVVRDMRRQKVRGARKKSAGGSVMFFRDCDI
jgi:hypothetical protein